MHYMKLSTLRQVRRVVCDVNLMDSFSLIAQPGNPNCAINCLVNNADTNGVNPIECNLNSNLNCKVMVSQARSQYNQRSPYNSGFGEKSLTVQPVCCNRTTNRINGNKGQDVIVKSMEYVNKNKRNKSMESQNNQEFDDNVPAYCKPLSMKLLGSLAFIEAAKSCTIQKKKIPNSTTAGNNNGINKKDENKEVMSGTHNLHNKAPHNKFRGNKGPSSSCAFLSSNPKPFPIGKKEKYEVK